MRPHSAIKTCHRWARSTSRFGLSSVNRTMVALLSNLQGKAGTWEKKGLNVGKKKDAVLAAPFVVV
jgi:hypothetical protein